MSNVTAVTRFNPSLALLDCGPRPHRLNTLLMASFASPSDVPSFSDPHIPVVAREMMQRMIRQFAAEYTSKTSTSQDPLPDPQPCSVQSLPRPPSFPPVTPSTSPSGASPAAAAASVTTAAAAHNQNPVLSKLLMADQEAPLDLTVKKPKAEPTEQGATSLSKHAHPLTETRRPTHRRPA